MVRSSFVPCVVGLLSLAVGCADSWIETNESVQASSPSPSPSPSEPPEPPPIEITEGNPNNAIDPPPSCVINHAPGGGHNAGGVIAFSCPVNQQPTVTMRVITGSGTWTVDCTTDRFQNGTQVTAFCVRWVDVQQAVNMTFYVSCGAARGEYSTTGVCPAIP